MKEPVYAWIPSPEQKTYVVGYIWKNILKGFYPVVTVFLVDENYWRTSDNVKGKRWNYSEEIFYRKLDDHEPIPEEGDVVKLTNWKRNWPLGKSFFPCYPYLKKKTLEIIGRV